MKYSRRKFIRTSALTATSLIYYPSIKALALPRRKNSQPKVVYTWNYGAHVGQAAMEIINEGGSGLDAIIKAINIVESDPTIKSVGLGGLPDASGEVTLDASVMDWRGNAGAVAYLKYIENPISVARLVMEKTPHVLLAGKGALDFAIENGFKKVNLLTPESKKAWERWKKKKSREITNHDTIGMLAIDSENKLNGGVSTSGLSYKLPGRVGDSPIIGAGLFVDNSVGAACSTGMGELAIKTAGSFLVVEKMREGYSPEEACKIAIERTKKYGLKTQICFLALNSEGETGAYSLLKGFSYMVASRDGVRLLSSKHLL